MIEFNSSRYLTIGTEIEIQIVNKVDHDLFPFAEHLLKHVENSPLSEKIKPEITQSMLEINSGIHSSPKNLLNELEEIRNFLVNEAKELDIYLTGGGTHPFQLWNHRKIYPKLSYKKTAYRYGYLAKMFTVFGLHIHIGCLNGDDAIYLIQALARYIPHFIALSASSPFCQGIDTEFHSSRNNIVNLFPLAGLPNTSSNWQEFSDYCEQMFEFNIAEKIDNFYWDIRPKPNYGTIEIRVCDAPLSISKVALLAAYAQTLAHYLLTERPAVNFSHDRYDFYRYNRFQASRFGFQGKMIDSQTQKQKLIQSDILDTCADIAKYAAELNNQTFIREIIQMTAQQQNDAQWLRQLYEKGYSLKEIVYLKSQQWLN